MTRPRSRFVDRRREIAAQIREIDELVLRAEDEADLDLRQYLAKFAVVRLSGLLEFALANMLLGFLEESSGGRALKFASMSARKITNLNPKKLEDLLASFDEDWRADFSGFLAVDERRQSLGNLIGARHALAHGNTTSVSTALLRSYHDVADQTVKRLMTYFLPVRASQPKADRARARQTRRAR